MIPAQDEARLLGHTHLGTEHILLGLIREGEGVAAQVLAGLGLDLHYARQRVSALLAGRVSALEDAPLVADDPRHRLAVVGAGLAVIERKIGELTPEA